MQRISITATHILTIFLTVLLYLITYIDDIVIQHATNNVDACTHCAYLFFVFSHIQSSISYHEYYTQSLSSAEVSRIPLNSFQFSVVLRRNAEGNLCQKIRPNTELTGGGIKFSILHNICHHYTAKPAFNIV